MLPDASLDPSKVASGRGSKARTQASTRDAASESEFHFTLENEDNQTLDATTHQSDNSFRFCIEPSIHPETSTAVTNGSMRNGGVSEGLPPTETTSDCASRPAQLNCVANGDYQFARPPRRLSKRALSLSQQSHSSPHAPTTPRTRSPCCSAGTQKTDRQSFSHCNPNSNGIDTVARGDPSSQAVIDSTKPTLFQRVEPPAEGVPSSTLPRRDASVASEYSADDIEKDMQAVSVAPTAAMEVSQHRVFLPGSQWGSVLLTSRDTIERTILNEVAQATSIDAQFIRVNDLNAPADKSGLEVAVSVVHPDTSRKEDLDERLRICKFDNTMLLHKLRTDESGVPAYGLAALLPDAKTGTIESKYSSPNEPRDPPASPVSEVDQVTEMVPPAHSFVNRVGDGLLLIDYFDATSQKPVEKKLEFFFDGQETALMAKFVKQCVGQHLNIPVEALMVRFAGNEVADEANGAAVGWVNGSVVDVVRVKQATPVVLPVDPVTAPNPGAAVKANMAGNKGGAIKTGGAKKKSTAKSSQGLSTSPTRGTQWPGEQKKKTVPPLLLQTRGRQTVNKTNGRERSHSQPNTRGRRRVVSQPSVRKTQSSVSRHYLRREVLSADLVTPRVFTPRSPRPGAERSPTVALQYALTPTARRLLSSSSSRNATRRGSLLQASVGIPASRLPLPPQHVCRAVVSTTPRAPVRVPVHSGTTPAIHESVNQQPLYTSVGGSDRNSTAASPSTDRLGESHRMNGAADTPSVSRRSRSPISPAGLSLPGHRHHPAGYSSQHGSVKKVVKLDETDDAHMQHHHPLPERDAAQFSEGLSIEAAMNQYSEGTQSDHLIGCGYEIDVSVPIESGHCVFDEEDPEPMAAPNPFVSEL